MDISKQKLVVVLGMHRSGTSAVARGLQVLGVELGDSLVVQQEDNVKGFWEDSDFKILNQDMLRALGRDWHSVSLLTEDGLFERLSAFHWRALELLRVKTEGFSYFGLKDPRTCLLMPFWKKILQQSSIDASYIVVVRHPLSVSRSLRSRNGFGAEKSFYLWMQHMLSAVVSIMDEKAIVVDFDCLLENTGAELTRIANHLCLNQPAAEKLSVYEGQYLDSALRHSCYQSEDLEYADGVFPELISAYRLLLGLASGQIAFVPDDVKEQFTLLKQHLNQKSLLLSYIDKCEFKLLDLNTHLTNAEKTIHKREEAIQEMSEAVRNRDSKLKSFKEEVDTAIQQRDEKLKSLKEELDTVARQRDEKLESLKEELNFAVEQRAGKLNSVEKAVKQRDVKLEKLRKEVGSLKSLKAEDVGLFESQKKALLEQQQSLQDKVDELSMFSDQVRRSPGWLMEQKIRRLLEKKQVNAEVFLSEKGAIDAPVVSEGELDEFIPGHNMELLQRSGLFDATYYLRCYPDVKRAGVDPLRHYFLNGAKEGRNPHPLFASAWYLKSNPDVATAKANPLMHYLEFGSGEGRDPHPFFSGSDYKARYPEVSLADQNPLSHYWQSGLAEGCEPHFLFDTQQYLSDHPELEDDKSLAYADCLKNFEGRKRKSFGVLAADSSVHLSFDWGQQQRFIDGIRRRRLLEQGGVSVPLISIVMATRDRKSQIGAAIDSILVQTWVNWELLIVDDGSEDETTPFVQQRYADPRIHIQRIEPSGVSHARNVGLAQAQGEWIAYLDSDNQWFNCFLEIMLAYVTQQGADFAYSAIRLLQDEGIAYRYHDFVADDLLAKNYIDLNSIFHHRHLYDQVGEFDTALPRTVDWDLIIRYAREASKVVHVPFVGADYDDRQSANRITVREFNAWRFVVTNKNAIDWPVAQQRAIKLNQVCVIVPVLGSIAEITRCVEALLAANKNDAYQIVLVDTGANQAVLDLLTFVAASRASVKHVLYRGAQTLALAHNFGAAQTDAEYLVFLDPLVEVMFGWLQPLVNEMAKQECGAVQPKILSADGSVCQIGMVFSEQSALGYHLYTGMQSYAACANKARSYQALGSGCLLVRRNDFFRLGGFYALYINDLETTDFCLQLTEEGSQCWSAPSSCVVSHRKRENTEHLLQNRRVFIQRWAGRVQSDDHYYYKQDGFHAAGWVTDGVQPAELALYQPLLKRVNSGVGKSLSGKVSAKKPLFALKVPCPNEQEKHEWGDYHFACSLGAALKRQGYEFRIDLRDQWEARSKVAANEVNLLLRGRGELPLRDDQLNLMWLISHPDRTSLDELRRYNHVFVASSVYTDYLHKALGDDAKEWVSCLLQCTDPGIFYPGDKEAGLTHDVLFVGNSRNQYRDSVRLALEAGLEPAVYGTRWPQFISGGLIKGENIPNADLGRYYRSAGVVLNDHWPDMREKGFISNRIFDVLACGGALVSDEVQGLPEALLAGVAFFDVKSGEDFRQAVALAQRENVVFQQQRFDRALYVHENHSFNARALAILSRVRQLL